MVPRTLVAAAALLVFLMSACALLLDIEDRTVADAEGGVDGGFDRAVEAAADGAEGACPTGMILATTFCIDATEVTQEAYQAFLAETGDDAGGFGQIEECASNTTFRANQACKPFTFDPLSKRPMACVDWCDAYAYCAWAGKRLCGMVGGGSVPFDHAFLVSTSDQWFSACSRLADGRHEFPYGGPYQPGLCNDLDHEAGAPIEVSSLPACAGGYEGLFDMSGNVAEWEDSCTDEDGGDRCETRGGSFAHGSGWFTGFLACAGHFDFAGRTATSHDLGFRCCGR